MSDKIRDHAAEQENSAVNLANLDVDDAPLSGRSDAEVPESHDGEGMDPTEPKPGPDQGRRTPD